MVVKKNVALLHGSLRPVQVVPRYNIISGTCEKLCYSKTSVTSDIHDYRFFPQKKCFFSPFSPRNGCVGVHSLGTTQFLCYKQFNEHYHQNSKLTSHNTAMDCEVLHAVHRRTCIVSVYMCARAYMYATVHSRIHVRDCPLAHTCTRLSTRAT